MIAYIATALWFLLYALTGFGLLETQPNDIMNILALIIAIAFLANAFITYRKTPLI